MKRRPASLLLDTTIQIERLAGNQRELMDRDLCRFQEIYATSISYREFLATLIQDLNDVVDAGAHLAKENCVRLSDICRHFAELRGGKSRSAQRKHYAIARALDSQLPDPVDLDVLQSVARRSQNQWSREFFRYSCSFTLRNLRREIHCLQQAEDQPGELERLRRQRPLDTNPPFPTRGAARLLEGRKGEIRRLEAAIGKLGGHRDRGLLQALRWARGEGEEYDFLAWFPDKAERTRRRFSDLLIALEAPPGVAIYSTDRHFEVICEALSIDRYTGPESALAPTML